MYPICHFTSNTRKSLHLIGGKTLRLIQKVLFIKLFIFDVPRGTCFKSRNLLKLHKQVFLDFCNFEVSPWGRKVLPLHKYMILLNPIFHFKGKKTLCKTASKSSLCAFTPLKIIWYRCRITEFHKIAVAF